MTNLTAVARFHLVQRINYRIVPWGVLIFTFVVDIVILKVTPAGHGHARYVGGLAGPACVLFALGVQSVASSRSIDGSGRRFVVGLPALERRPGLFGAAFDREARLCRRSQEPIRAADQELA
jgi:hypothetical protein